MWQALDWRLTSLRPLPLRRAEAATTSTLAEEVAGVSCLLETLRDFQQRLDSSAIAVPHATSLLSADSEEPIASTSQPDLSYVGRLSPSQQIVIKDPTIFSAFLGD